jgi:hypothetical protein
MINEKAEKLTSGTNQGDSRENIKTERVYVTRGYLKNDLDVVDSNLHTKLSTKFSLSVFGLERRFFFVCDGNTVYCKRIDYLVCRVCW